MKSILTGIIILMVFFTGAKGQAADTIKKPRFAIGISQFITGSGFAPGTEFIITVIPDNIKNLSLGFYFDTQRKRIAGITIHQEMTLRKFASNKIITPYAYFNLIYRRTKIREVQADNNTIGDFGMYKSIEHHLGIGLRVRIVKDFYIKSSLGYGLHPGFNKKNLIS